MQVHVFPVPVLHYIDVRGNVNVINRITGSQKDLFNVHFKNTVILSAVTLAKWCAKS